MPLITQLQRDAADSRIPVSQLVRRSVVAAYKLKLNDFAEWLQHEQSGYPSGLPVPDYRIVRIVDFTVLNPVRGYIPIHMSIEMREALSHHPVDAPVSQLENMLERAYEPGHTLYTGIPSEILQMLNTSDADILDYSTTRRHIDPESFRRIIETVRDTILKWTLDLEARGILGDDMSFSDEEKIAASQAPQNVSYFYGPIHNSQFQVNSPKSQQYMQSDSGAVEALKSFIESFADSLTEAQLEGEVREELEAELSTLRAQANSPKPKPPIIVSTLHSIRSVLENAAGSALATAAVPTILTLIDRFGDLPM